jgi:hypothetical protein
MTTEVMWGNDHLEPKVEVMEISQMTETQKQTKVFLEIAEALHAKEQEIAELKRRVTELEQLLQSK